MHRLLRMAVTLVLLAAPVALYAQEDGETATAIFAGGCFWCMEPPYDKLDGVRDTTSGFIGGDRENISYQDVASGNTDYVEAVKVTYDPEQVSYDRLLDIFWHNIDPLDDGGQFCDRGYQYTTGIFATTDAQRSAARASRRELAESGRFDKPVVTRVEQANGFVAAKEYHQNYYQKRPVRYKFYRASCGRDGRLGELWGEKAG